MLLACCFGGSNKKKHKKIKKWENKKEKSNEESDELSNSLISTPIISPTFTNPVKSSKIKAELPDTNLCQEKHQSPGKEIRLHKNRDEIQIQRRSLPANYESPKCASTSFSKDPQNQISSPSFTNIQPKIEQQLVPRDVSRMFASAEDLERSNLSIFNTYESFKISNRSLVTSSSQPTSEDLILSTQSSNKQLLPHSHGNLADTQYMALTSNHNSAVEEVDAKSTSAILNEEELLPKKKTNKEKREKEEEKEVFLTEIREKTKKQIDALKIQHLLELEKVKDTFDVKLLEEKENLRKDLENVTTNTKNKANAKIAQLNKQIVLERGEIFVEQQESSKYLEEEFRLKEDRLNQSLIQIKEREQAWEDERADVLREVQRLKSEATRMVTILAMQYEEENSIEDKKRSLSQEVYSLQLVVEMRTGEMRNLREKLIRGTEELEQAEIVKVKLGKATSRIEDLEEQIKIKNILEKQLSVEKSHLEMNISDTTKTADRMCKDVESLQWRIRNNFDLPADNLTPLTSEQQSQDLQRTSLPAYFAEQINDSITTSQQSNMMKDKKLESNKRKSMNFKESDEMMEADIINTKMKGYVEDRAVTNDYSANKKQIMGDNLNSSEPDDKDSPKEFNDIEEIKFNDFNNEVDSLDEGVGDISSDCDHPDSPSFDYINGITNNNKNSENPFITKSATNDERVSDLSLTLDSDLHSNMNRSNSSTTSPVKERIPSRFSFDKQH